MMLMCSIFTNGKKYLKANDFTYKKIVTITCII